MGASKVTGSACFESGSHDHPGQGWLGLRQNKEARMPHTHMFLVVLGPESCGASDHGKQSDQFPFIIRYTIHWLCPSGEP